MASLTATIVDTLFNLAGQVSNPTIESWIDYAIDQVNSRGADLPNMTGTSGNKTVGLESAQRGVVLDVVRAIYYSCYKGVESSTVAGLTVSNPDLLSNPQVQAAIEKGARRLAELDVDYG